MRNELSHIENIEHYLEGILSAEDKSSFEQRLSSEYGLKESVELQKNISERIEISALKDVIKQVYDEKYGSGFNFRGIILIALICLGLTYAGWTYFHSGSQEGKITSASVHVE